MLNLNSLPSESSATIIRVDPRPLGDDRGLRWDVDLTFPLASPADIVAADAVINGTSYLVANAESNGTRATLKDRTKRPDVSLVIKGADNEAIVNGASAEIRFTTLEVNGKVAAVTMRVRMRGAPEQRIGLLHNYGEEVGVVMKGVQVDMPFDGTDAHAIEEGDIVTTDDDFAGMVQSVTDKFVQLLDCDGMDATVSRDHVSSVVKVAPPEGGTMAKQVAAYKRRCNRKAISPSWSELLSAISKAVTDGKAVDADGAWVLDQDVIDAAVGIGTPVASLVPPAADEAASA